jgi:hypothetical protein
LCIGNQYLLLQVVSTYTCSVAWKERIYIYCFHRKATGHSTLI